MEREKKEIEIEKEIGIPQATQQGPKHSRDKSREVIMIRKRTIIKHIVG